MNRPLVARLNQDTLPSFYNVNIFKPLAINCILMCLLLEKLFRLESCGSDSGLELLSIAVNAADHQYEKTFTQNETASN